MKAIIRHFHDSQHHTALQHLYGQIPSGNCAQCPACCHDNVPLSIVEVVDLIVALGSQLDAYIMRAQLWYLNQYRRVQPCIFLQDDLCSIYPVRPLTCRLFGHQSPAEQQKRTEQVRRDKAIAADWLREQYDIVVADAVVNHAIAPCDFKATRTLDRQAANASFDAVNQLSTSYYSTGLIEADLVNLTLIEWLLYFFCDEDALFDEIISSTNRHDQQ